MSKALGRFRFGEKVGEARAALGFTQAQFAEWIRTRTGLQVKENQIRSYEAGAIKENWSLDYLMGLRDSELMRHIDGTPYSHDDFMTILKDQEPIPPFAISRFLWNWVVTFWDGGLKELIQRAEEKGLENLQQIMSGERQATEEDMKKIAQVFVNPEEENKPYPRRTWEYIRKGELLFHVLHPPLDKEEPMPGVSLGDCIRYWREQPKPHWNPQAEGVYVEMERTRPWSTEKLAEVISREFHQTRKPVTAVDIEKIEAENQADTRLYALLASLRIFKPLDPDTEPFDNTDLQRIAEGRLDWRTGDVCVNPASKENCPKG